MKINRGTAIRVTLKTAGHLANKGKAQCRAREGECDRVSAHQQQANHQEQQQWNQLGH